MCEWLSREEWCDVRLLCGGRAFGAHRAVLASVSSFLRRILLSCPIEDTPTLIVLPDFDLEAMSAVLYYIYNGEVTVPRQKLEKFLDIVKAMQIFIDRQYLTQLSVDIEIEIDYNLNKSEERIFVLGNEDSSLVTFRKVVQQTRQRNAKVTEMQAPRNWNEHFKPVLGNLQSEHGDRQSDYFLRDSLMETYPLNRSSNGLAGVPALPNRCYRAPTSPFLTNANGYLSPDTVYLPSDNTDASQPYNLKLANDMTLRNTALTELRRKLSANLTDVWTGQPPKFSVKRHCNGGKWNHLDISALQTTYTAVLNSIAKDKMLMDKMPWFPNFENKESKVERCSNVNIPITEVSHNKIAILNKALDNPWCPRLPNSFRPFRRKSVNTYQLNDSNNNSQVIPSLVKEEKLDAPDIVNHCANLASTFGDVKEYENNQTCTESTRNGRYSCNECGKTFSQLRNFKYHMSVHRGTREFAASCTVCGKSFNDRGYLSSHMKIHRNRKEYKCTQCPKSFNQRVAYNMHVRIHTGVKPHVCPTCGKAFSRKMLLKQHQRTHSGERPYACPHCEKRFADRSNMTLHLRLHTGVKPFKCPMCPKSFTKKHHLKSHVNFHTGAKPYSCPRCRLAFTQSSNMRTHLKRCTAPEPAVVTDENTT